MIALLVFLVVLVVVLIIIVLNQPVVTDGVIVDMRHEDSMIWYTYMPMKVGVVTIFIPMMHFDDEDWILTLKGKDQKGEDAIADLYVPKSVYLKVRIGMHYKMQPGDSVNDETVEQEVEEVPEDAEVRE